jgi:hypothetical protein
MVIVAKMKLDIIAITFDTIVVVDVVTFIIPLAFLSMLSPKMWCKAHL